MLKDNSIELLTSTVDSMQEGTILVDGPSGSGKSTLITNYLRQLTLQRAGCFSYIPQHGNLFSGSVEENIKFFRDVCDSKVLTAMKLANITHIKPSAVINSGGDPLSGGERQRLVFARAMVAKQTDLIVIDEGFSAMDEENSHTIFRYIIEKYKKVIFTTHSKSLKFYAQETIRL